MLGQTRTAETVAAPAQRCGLTTLDGTIVWENGKLRCGPGDALAVRSELHSPKTARRGSKIVSFVALSDFHLADEESPLRGEWFDKCGEQPFKDAFRLQDALLPALVNSQIRAANDIVRSGGPVTGEPIDFAVQLGDAAENQQHNEIRDFIDLLDGGGLVDPDSGADGYDGNQSRDPYVSPVPGASLLDLANEPFWAEGLRRADGSAFPWYSVAGGHDVKVRGIMPNDNDAWKTFARAWVTGSLMVNDLAPDQQQRVCADPTILLDPAFWTQVAARPGSARLIPADADRKLLDRSQWAAEHSTTRGVPAGHGPSARNRCKDADGNPLARLCYSVDLPASLAGSPPVHVIALDTAPDEAGTGGNIDQAQWNWLNADLKAHSACFYPSDDAAACTEKTGKRSSLIVVVSHHGADGLTHDTPRLDGQSTYKGQDVQRLLLRFPNVVLHAVGETHHNKITPRERSSGGGYWEVATASVADFPHQGRVIELVDNHDGTLSVFGVAFDAAAPVDPSKMRWSDDPTPETHAAFGKAERAVNEEMLASIARWVGANDPQRGAAKVEYTPAAGDKNVELVLKHPTGGVRLTVSRRPPRSPRLPRFVFRPRFPFGGFPFPRPTVGVFRPQPQRTFPVVPKPQQVYATTSRGVGAPASGPALQIREYLMTFIAGAIAYALIQRRIRRNQLGL